LKKKWGKEHEKKTAFSGDLVCLQGCFWGYAVLLLPGEGKKERRRQTFFKRCTLFLKTVQI
jgi:hypothetical protein